MYLQFVLECVGHLRAGRGDDAGVVVLQFAVAKGYGTGRPALNHFTILLMVQLLANRTYCSSG